MAQVQQQVLKTKESILLAEPEKLIANILVATDFSPASEQALEYALSFARAYDAKVYLLHVLVMDSLTARELGGTLRERLYREARDKMDRTLELGRFVGVPHEVIVEEGSLWPVISAQMEKNQIDLVVIGTHGARVVERMLLGSSAEQVFRQSQVPVLTVGPKILQEPLYGIEPKNILLATELEGGAERKTQYAFSLAQEHRSKLTMLHVVPKSYTELTLLERDAITSQLRGLLPHELELHCLPIFRVEQGEPAEEILRAAGEIHADLIVLGAKPKSLLGEYLPRTKAYQIVSKAPCPVLTVQS
jgi:nucleotide-binding universal stress UspA family protein